jgi:hypothetical protein
LRSLVGGVTTDDPFGGASQPAQIAHLDASTIELAAKIFSAILADLAAGKPAQHTVANVRTMMISATTAKPRGAAARCSIRSRRLLPPGKVLAI